METCIAYESHKFKEHAEKAVTDSTYECLDDITDTKKEEESTGHENDNNMEINP